MVVTSPRLVVMVALVVTIALVVTVALVVATHAVAPVWFRGFHAHGRHAALPLPLW